MLNALHARWIALPRSDKWALAYLETFVLLISLVGLSSASNWQQRVIGVGALFVVAQTVVGILIGIVALTRRKTPMKAEAVIQKGIAGLFIVGMLYGVGGYVADWMFPDSPLAIRWRYSLESTVEHPVYFIDKRPHDCEFLTAPIGDKHCHYDRNVSINQNHNPTSPEWGSTYVYVSWQKVDE